MTVLAASDTLNVALVKLVNVALPVASPDNVRVGSAVAVVVIETSPRLVIVPEPVTAPVKVIVGSDVAVVVMVISDEPLNEALPVTAPPTAIVLAVVNVAAEPVIFDVIVEGR